MIGAIHGNLLVVNDVASGARKNLKVPACLGELNAKVKSNIQFTAYQYRVLRRER